MELSSLSRIGMGGPDHQVNSTRRLEFRPIFMRILTARRQHRAKATSPPRDKPAKGAGAKMMTMSKDARSLVSKLPLHFGVVSVPKI
jgi:hypothetical protein